MRLALKLLSSLAAVVVIVLLVSGIAEQRRRDELLAMDLDDDRRAALVIHNVVGKVCDLAGPEVARSVVETVNKTTARSIRWLTLDEVPNIPGKDLAGELRNNMSSGEAVTVLWPNGGGDLVRYLYIPIAHDGQPVAVIEASESMAPRTAYVKRSQVQTAAVGVLVLMVSATLAAVLGRRMIGRPIAAIADSVRTLGTGEFVAPAIVSRRDELGTLATELTALGERLAARERMRHDDRLRTVGQLASGVAHELGTPLSVIAVRARAIASREATGEEAVAHGAAILEQTERMTRLVRQLLDYSRRSSGAATDLDLRQSALQAVEMLEPLARAHGVTMVAEADLGDVHVRGDASQIQQVITNLVMNGIQAMPSGGRLELRCGRDDDTPARRRARCWIRVSDEGPGIPEEDLVHVFEPFFTTKPAGEGTGLGLAVAQAIVEEHGGVISVHSEPGRGTSFTVSLPALATTERLAS
jgi:two-component system NtrC family sensor kinase